MNAKIRRSSTRYRRGRLSEARRDLDGRRWTRLRGQAAACNDPSGRRFRRDASITICPLTTHVVDAPLLRPPIEPSKQNGLRAVSLLMIDKVTTVSKVKFESRIGRLSDEDIVRVNRAVLVFLGLAGAGAK